MTKLYLDASAAVKLVVEEPGSWALAERISDATLFSNRICEIEIARALMRRGLAEIAQTLAGRLVGRLDLIAIDDEIVAPASTIGPPDLRALDAIHLATAVRIRADLDGFMTYDERLAAAASAVGLPVESPGD